MKPRTMAMRSSDVLDLVNELELEYPVHEWRIGGVCVWPLIRVRLYTDILAHGLMGSSPTAVERTTRASARLLKASVRGLVGARVAPAASPVPELEVDALFLTDGVSYARIGEQWFEKYYDPIILWLEEQGLRYSVLTPGGARIGPTRTATVHIERDVASVSIRAACRHLFGAGRRTAQLSGVAELLAQVRARVAGAHRYDEARIRRLGARLVALAAYFEGRLAIARPRRAFVNTYYSLEGMAFVLACRRAGVTVADVQHGVQGEQHVAYGRWRNVPPCGWELLPDEFWVWSDAERRIIESWRPPDRHQAVVTGNPWLQLWMAGQEPRVEQEVSRVRGAAAGLRASKHVLVSFQWGLPAEETSKILDAIEACPADYHWWLRLHPLMLHEQTALAAAVSRRGFGNCNVEVATDAPLPALLHVIDVNVTHSSSTVLEAQAFGIPSVLTSVFGAEIFADEIREGTAVVALGAADIARAVCGSVRRAAVSEGTSRRLQALLHHAFGRVARPMPERLVGGAR